MNQVHHDPFLEDRPLFRGDAVAPRSAFEMDRRWIAHVVWEDEDAIEASSIVEDPGVAELSDQLKSESMTYGRFRRGGGKAVEPAR
jgi:hypothetical protein